MGERGGGEGGGEGRGVIVAVYQQEMTAEEAAIIKSMDKCDFTHMHQYYTERSEERKAMTKDEKLVLKQENEKILEEYGWCVIDGHKERIDNFRIIPPGLFKGRGNHPKQGKIRVGVACAV